MCARSGTRCCAPSTTPAPPRSIMLDGRWLTIDDPAPHPPDDGRHGVRAARGGAARRQGRVRARRRAGRGGRRGDHARTGAPSPSPTRSRSSSRRRSAARRRVRICRAAAAVRGSTSTYEAQLAAKQRIVAEQLRRIAGLDVPVAPVLRVAARVRLPPAHQAARRRRRGRILRGGLARSRAGRALPARRAGHRRGDRVGRGAGARARRAGAPHRADRSRRATATASCSPARWRARGTRATTRVAAPGWRRTRRCRDWRCAGAGGSGAGATSRVELAPEADLALTAHAPAFTQVNPAMNRLLVETVLAWVDPQPGQRVLDLYAGAGNLSLPLRRRGATVIAVEQDRQAAADAAANAERHPGPPLRVICERAERAVEQLGGRGRALRRRRARPAAQRRGRLHPGAAPPRARRAWSTSRATRRRWRAICARLRRALSRRGRAAARPLPAHLPRRDRGPGQSVLRDPDPWCIVRAASRVGRAAQAPPHARAHVMMHTQRAEGEN